MAITREHRQWKSDFNQWAVGERKYKNNNKKLFNVMHTLERLVKSHLNEIKSFEKRARANARLISNGTHSPSFHSKIRKLHNKQKNAHKLNTKKYQEIFKITKNLQKSIRNIH